MTSLVLLAVLMACQVRPQQPITPAFAVPARDARETSWSQFIAIDWQKNAYVGQTTTELRLPDDSRVDLFVRYKTGERVAWEVERCGKWKEAVGQAVFYQIMSDATRGGVVLIALGDASDKQNILRCKLVCRELGLDFAVIDEHGVIR